MAADSPPMAEDLRFRLGTVALRSDPIPAKFSFQKADGQIDYPGERAATAAGGLLGKSISDPLADTLVGAATFVMSPVVAAKGAVTASKRLSTDKLTECETDLTRAMSEMAIQQRFHDWFLRVAGEQCPGRLIPIKESENGLLDRSRFAAVLEARIEELRLERTGKGDTSYALLIKARTRLLRSTDGAVLYDQPAEYRSGKCLFLDWTLHHAFQSVAETGYRQLADQTVEELLSNTDRPLLTGAGFDKQRRSNRAGAADAFAHNSERAASSGPAEISAFTRDPISTVPPVLQKVGYVTGEVTETEPFGISFSANASHVTVQRPLTRQESSSEALRDVEWAFDGLDNHPNPIVALGATVVAVPISLWKQGAAIANGLSPKKIAEAAAKLDKVASQTRPTQALALEVTRRLEADQFHVRLVKYAITDATSPSRDSGISLEIHVESAALRGKSDASRQLALCIEASATLRSADGEQLYSCPVQYRSTERKFTDWAIHDAEPFRKELQQCYRTLSALVVDQLAARHFLPRSEGQKLLVSVENPANIKH